MASQTTTTRKRAARTATKTAAKAARPKQKTTEAASNSSEPANGSRRKPLREMTLEELSLRAYKMTYERLHGSKSKKK